MTIEVDEYKQRYSAESIVQAACDGVINEFDKMAVSAKVSVMEYNVKEGLKS